MVVENKSIEISIKLNAIINYFGQAYTIVVAIIVTPLYLQYLGAEAYGLVGFFMLLQNWLSLLDMGLSTTLGRQVAYARGQINGFKNFIHLLRSFESIFFIITSGIVSSIYFSSNWLAHNWIKPIVLSSDVIEYCIVIMGLIVGLRFYSAIYKSGINGFEDQIWINKSSIIINSLKYIGSFLILAYFTNNVRHFFEYQLAIGILEVVCLNRRFYYDLPSFKASIAWFEIDWSVFKVVLPFTLGIAYTSTILIIITQFDKLLLSGLLTLEEFGYFSLITLIAGAIVSLSIPVYQAFLPRITLLVSKDNIKDAMVMYVNMTQVIAWVTFSSSMIICIMPQEILYVLTGNKKAYLWGHNIMYWYVIGSAINVLGTFQYYLQNAFGTLKLYAIGLTISLIVQVPLIYMITTKYGALGSGKLWFVYSTVWFLGWTFVVHNKIVPGFHFKWLAIDLLPIAFCTLFLAYFLDKIISIDMNDSRTIIGAKIIFIGIGYLILTSLCVHSIRYKTFEIYSKIAKKIQLRFSRD